MYARHKPSTGKLEPDRGNPCQPEGLSEGRRGASSVHPPVELRPFQRTFVREATRAGIDTAALSLPRGNGKPEP